MWYDGRSYALNHSAIQDGAVRPLAALLHSRLTASTKHIRYFMGPLDRIMCINLSMQ